MSMHILFAIDFEQVVVSIAIEFAVLTVETFAASFISVQLELKPMLVTNEHIESLSQEVTTESFGLSADFLQLLPPLPNSTIATTITQLHSLDFPVSNPEVIPMPIPMLDSITIQGRQPHF